MAVSSFLQVTDLVMQTALGYTQVRFAYCDFESEMQNLVTQNEEWYKVFVAIPEDYLGSFQENVNSYRVRVFVVAPIQADRSNVASVVSDSALILSDLWRDLFYGSQEYELTGDGIPVAINNSRLDILAGAWLDMEFIVEPGSVCEIPRKEDY